MIGPFFFVVDFDERQTEREVATTPAVGKAKKKTRC
jgi:hypothetical protein